MSITCMADTHQALQHFKPDFIDRKNGRVLFQLVTKDSWSTFMQCKNERKKQYGSMKGFNQHLGNVNICRVKDTEPVDHIKVK